MLPEGFLNSLKAYKFSVMGRDAVITSFPELLANVCRMMKVTNVFGLPQAICYDWGKLLEFKINFSNAIAFENFDMLDNIILEFFSSYHYNIITPDGSLVMFKVDFPEDETQKFVNTCNAFKGREWDDILPEFLDALYSYTSKATIHGDDLESWH